MSRQIANYSQPAIANPDNRAHLHVVPCGQQNWYREVMQALYEIAVVTQQYHP